MNRQQQLDALQQEMHACGLCSLGDVKPIFEGDAEDRIMLVGQAPARHRTDPHRPFSQGTGRKKLFKWLEDAGLGSEEEFRDKVYMTSIAKCYPGPSRSGHGDEPPSKEQLKRCAPFFERELDLIRPALIIAVGKLAIERLIGKCTLSEVVGHSFEKDFGEWKSVIVPLPHPSGASLWNNLPQNQALVREAIERLAELSQKL